MGANDVPCAGLQGGGELGPLFQCQVGRHTKAGLPMADEGAPAGLCLNVGEGDCLQHPARPLYYGEEVLEPFLGDRDVGEVLLGHQNWLHCGSRLAGLASPCPAAGMQRRAGGAEEWATSQDVCGSSFSGLSTS